jgi:hypothetical protein
MIEEEKTKIITKNVVFEGPEYQIVRNLVEEEGYGRRGFSIALRKIIREWAGDRYGGTEKKSRFLGEGIKPPDKSEEFLFLIGDTAEAEKAAG